MPRDPYPGKSDKIAKKVFGLENDPDTFHAILTDIIDFCLDHLPVSSRKWSALGVKDMIWTVMMALRTKYQVHFDKMSDNLRDVYQIKDVDRAEQWFYGWVSSANRSGCAVRRSVERRHPSRSFGLDIQAQIRTDIQRESSSEYIPPQRKSNCYPEVDTSERVTRSKKVPVLGKRKASLAGLSNDNEEVGDDEEDVRKSSRPEEGELTITKVEATSQSLLRPLPSPTMSAAFSEKEHAPSSIAQEHNWRRTALVLTFRDQPQVESMTLPFSLLFYDPTQRHRPIDCEGLTPEMIDREIRKIHNLEADARFKDMYVRLERDIKRPQRANHAVLVWLCEMWRNSWAPSNGCAEMKLDVWQDLAAFESWNDHGKA